MLKFVQLTQWAIVALCLTHVSTSQAQTCKPVQALPARTTCWEVLEQGEWQSAVLWEEAQQRIVDCISTQKSICEEANSEFSVIGGLQILPVNYILDPKVPGMAIKFILSQEYECRSCYIPTLSAFPGVITRDKKD